MLTVLPSQRIQIHSPRKLGTGLLSKQVNQFGKDQDSNRRGTGKNIHLKERIADISTLEAKKPKI